MRLKGYELILRLQIYTCKLLHVVIYLTIIVNIALMYCMLLNQENYRKKKHLKNIIQRKSHIIYQVQTLSFSLMSREV